jgi:hypothetical protein
LPLTTNNLQAVYQMRSRPNVKLGCPSAGKSFILAPQAKYWLQPKVFA